jgi:hypothetical protein
MLEASDRELFGTPFDVARVRQFQHMKQLASVADILERECVPTINDWLRRVNLVPDLTCIPLSDADRTGHLPKLLSDLIFRLRLANDANPLSSESAMAHGEMRYAQGYSAPMLVDESRALQVATFSTLHLHHSELDHNRTFLDVMVIADEVDMQLTETMRGLMAAKKAKDAA